MSTNEMESKIRELRQLQALIDEATAEAEATTIRWRHKFNQASRIYADDSDRLRYLKMSLQQRELRLSVITQALRIGDAIGYVYYEGDPLFSVRCSISPEDAVVGETRRLYPQLFPTVNLGTLYSNNG